MVPILLYMYPFMIKGSEQKGVYMHVAVSQWFKRPTTYGVRRHQKKQKHYRSLNIRPHNWEDNKTNSRIFQTMVFNENNEERPMIPACPWFGKWDLRRNINLWHKFIILEQKPKKSNIQNSFTHHSEFSDLRVRSTVIQHACRDSPVYRTKRTIQHVRTFWKFGNRGKFEERLGRR